MSETAKWYVVHTYSGYENKVAENLEKLVENRKLQDLIQQIMIPTEHVVEVRDNGKTKEYDRKLFPSYVLVKMVMTDETWYIVRNTNGVTGFVGTTTKPTPLTQAEVDALGVEKSEISLSYAVGDSVSVVKGELEGFLGKVISIDRDHRRVTVKVSMFGQETTADMDLDAVVSLM